MIKTYSEDFTHDAEYSTKNGIKRSSHSGGILCKIIKISDWCREFLGSNSSTKLVNYLKWLNQFTVSRDAYPYAKYQHHNAILSWHNADLILGVTFGTPRKASLNPYEWTESNRYFCVCLTTCRESTTFLSSILRYR